MNRYRIAFKPDDFGYVSNIRQRNRNFFEKIRDIQKTLVNGDRHKFTHGEIINYRAGDKHTEKYKPRRRLTAALRFEIEKRHQGYQSDDKQPEAGQNDFRQNGQL